MTEPQKKKIDVQIKGMTEPLWRRLRQLLDAQDKSILMGLPLPVKPLKTIQFKAAAAAAGD